MVNKIDVDVLGRLAMNQMALEAVAFVVIVTLFLYFIVIAIQGTALVAQSLVSRRLPAKLYFSDLCQNLGVAIPIAGFLFDSLNLMVVGALLLAIGILIAEVRYRENRVVDLSLSLTAILSISSLGLVSSLV